MQQRSSSIKSQAINDALAELEREGVLDSIQRQRVAERLGAAGETHADRSGRVAAIIASMGGVLVAAGILYLVGYNWEELTKPVKLTLIFAIWGGLHVAGFVLAHRPGKYPRVGTALLATAVLSYGGAIALIAQIYNLSPKYPWSILLWALLNLPLVLLARSVLLLSIVSTLFVVWCFWHAGVHLEDLFPSADERLVFPLLLLSLGLGALMAAFGGRAERTRFATFQPYLRALGRVLALAAIYILSFDFMPKAWGIPVTESWTQRWSSTLSHQLLPFAIASAAAWLCMTVRLTPGAGAKAQSTAVWIGVTGLLVAAHFTLWPAGLFLFANLMLLVAVGLLIQAGVREGRAADINLGLGLFILWLVSRYMEYLWDKLEAATAFIGLGTLLLVGGFYLEKRRKHWIATSQRAAP